ncbi:MAG: hypothetical protein RKU31_16810 [Deltaproteobacteria bacterium]
MVGIKFPMQQTAAERNQPSMATPSRAQRALIAQVADKARTERAQLVALAADRTPDAYLELLNPVKAVSTIVGHYDNTLGEHEAQLAKLDELALGADSIGALIDRGHSIDAIRRMPRRKMEAEIGKGAAGAVRKALRNADVAAALERPESSMSWERGETYASAEHLRDPIDQLGLIVQDEVEAAHAHLDRVGGGGAIVKAALDVTDAQRQLLEDYGGAAAEWMMAQDSNSVKVAGFALGAAVEMTTTPYRIISTNVAASRQGVAVVDTMAAAAGAAGSVGRAYAGREVVQGVRNLASRARKSIAQVDVKKLIVKNPKGAAPVTPNSPTIPNVRAVKARSAPAQKPKTAPRPKRAPEPKEPPKAKRAAEPTAKPKRAPKPKKAPKVAPANVEAPPQTRVPDTITRELPSNPYVIIDENIRPPHRRPPSDWLEGLFDRRPTAAELDEHMLRALNDPRRGRRVWIRG